VQTRWRITARPSGEYHYFVHLLDAQGVLAAQYDSPPGSGDSSSRHWQPPQAWIERATITIPQGVSPGVYDLYAGWYRYPEIVRLAVMGTGKRAAEGYVYLTSIAVK
jgi:hypothetical protein